MTETKKSSTALIKVDDLDSAIERGIAAQQIAGKMGKAIAIAGAMQDIRSAFTPEIMKRLMALQGSAIGFRTDKDSTGGYKEDVLRDCAIEALMQGVHPVGNEFNIIAGRAYITKEGMGRKLSSIHGLSYSVTPGIPKTQDGGAVVPMEVEWVYPSGAAKQTKILQICVRVNAGMGADAIIGKATRKARAWLYATITGQEVPEGEVDDAKPVKGVVVEDKPSRFDKPAGPAAFGKPPELLGK
jgi:hypothetical protein